MKPAPPGWGDDVLSEFIQSSSDNTFATFESKKIEYANLSEMDDLFWRFVGNFINPRNLVEPLLMLRCHSAYRAGCRLAMSGQAVETFAVLRTCLEHALYALHISKNPTLAEVWLRRHDDVSSLRNMKRGSNT